MVTLYFPALLAVLLVTNLGAFAAFAYDKRAAKTGGWRISENTLIGLAFWGGSLGALIAQQSLRHKTRKEPFRSTLVVVALFHLGIGVWLTCPPLQQWLTCLAHNGF